MSGTSNFFNNTEKTIFDKFKEIAEYMPAFNTFHAVSGYFRSSGYFKLRKELENLEKIQILIGINIDDIFKGHNKAFLMLGSEEKAKELYTEEFIKDIKEAKYSAEVEEGILQLCEDLKNGKVEMKIHCSKNLHAKFYLCLPKGYDTKIEKIWQNAGGCVIMGSSNISDSGLGTFKESDKKENRYELNVALDGNVDVKYCKEQFDELWENGVKITVEDIEKGRKNTHIKKQNEMPTPYELYMKVLIEKFGEQAEDEFSLALPDGVKDLKYQRDAVIQGYQMLINYNGFFLADVVGLGKTNVATMIAKRFIETNGRKTNILVVYPGQVEKTWKDTFRQFGIERNAQFVTRDNLDKVLNGMQNYKTPEEFNLVIVDEAHNFRRDESDRYDSLQKACKIGEKKVILVSATPLNNRPEDIYNLLLLFQDKFRSSIDGINDLQKFFAPLIAEYKEIMQKRGQNSKDESSEKIEKIYEKIRNNILEKVTVRRTRNNILNDNDYKNDLAVNKTDFPKIEPPNELIYDLNALDKTTGALFFKTLNLLTNEKTGIFYARYRAVEFLDERHQEKFKNSQNIGQNLKGIYRTLMVKRLESSFEAFKRSLATFLKITEDMQKMFKQNKVLIIPEMDVKNLMMQGLSLDEIIQKAKKKGLNEVDFTFTKKDFNSKFEDMLENDRKHLKDLIDEWGKIKKDPKFYEFTNHKNELFNKQKNPTGKLVIFSESLDTANYLERCIKNEWNRSDVLKISSENRKKLETTINENFDASYNDGKEWKDDFNILITTDVLAEGVNLHRANVIVNYDSPWNATRLMQRIGRVNRIGSTAGKILNYMFYPSDAGDKEIGLYKDTLFKLQGFHSALGEDMQIYSKEEILKEFELFDSKIKDNVDEQLSFLREVRELYNKNRALYKQIKKIPMKSRTARKCSNMQTAKSSIVFLKSPFKIEYYKIADKVERIDFLTAARILKALQSEQSADFKCVRELHFEQVNMAIKAFEMEIAEEQEKNVFDNSKTDKQVLGAEKFLRIYASQLKDEELKEKITVLLSVLAKGKYNNLSKEINKIREAKSKDKQVEIASLIEDLHKEYPDDVVEAKPKINDSEPEIVLSETFV